MNMKNNTLLVKLMPVFFFVVYLILDIINIPTKLGVNIANINMDLFSAYLDAVIVIVLYLITYYLIDKRQIDRDNNTRELAKVMMLNTYMECLDDLEIVNDRASVAEYIIPKIDGDKVPGDNPVIFNLQNIPFSTKADVLDIAKNGHLSRKTIKDYLEIQKEYQYVINVKIIFYDLVNPKTAEQTAMYHSINHRYFALVERLNSEIEKLKQ